MIVREIYDLLLKIKGLGTTIFLIDQNLKRLRFQTI